MKTILVLTDFSRRAAHAAEFAMEIAVKADAELLLYNAFYAAQMVSLESGIYPYYEDYAEVEQQSIGEMDKLTQELKSRFADSHQIPPPPIRTQNEPGNLTEHIGRIAEKNDTWMIVMGDKSDESTLSRFISGSDSTAVIDNANCPVLLIPEKAELKEVRKILFAAELHRAEREAIHFLEGLAEMWHSQVTVLHVSDNAVSAEEKETHYSDRKKILDGIKYPDITYVDIRGDDISEAISTYAEKEQIDMIAIVHKKRSFIGSLLHKSISKKMLNYHKVPLLILNTS